MATQIVIGNKSHITVDDNFHIDWADKGKNWNDSWLPDTIHYVVWNSIGPNEIQNKDSDGMMTGNTPLNATSDSAGSTTIAAILDYEAAVSDDEANGTTNAAGKTWKDYDPNYS